MDIIGLVPSFGGFFFTIGAFVLALSVIVAVHEYGHYIVGRWSGIHAEVFSLGFGPVIFARRDRRGTRWQVAALPFGGYVKFSGDADAASGRDVEGMAGMEDSARRRTMHGAPLWARASTVAAGPIFNFGLSILVFAAVLMWQGRASDPLTIDVVRELPGQVELESGDEILAIAGETAPELTGLDAFVQALPTESPMDYTVRRGGSETTVSGPYPYPPLVQSLAPQSAAMDVGMQVGDVILSVEEQPITAFRELRDIVVDSGGRPLSLGVWRDGEIVELVLLPRRVDLPQPDGGFETRWLIGITGGLFFEPETETPGPLRALGYGAEQTLFIMRSSLSGLYHMAVGAISSCNLRGPIGIAQTSGQVASQGWSSFIWFIAVLSTAVGLLNLFPIPVLDGGHLVFHAWEAATGRPPSDRALRVLMTVGLGLLLSLMIFALTNDLFCP